MQDAARILNEAKRWPDLVVVDAMFPMDSNSPPAFMVGAFLDLLENVSARKEQALPDVILVSGQNQAAEQFEDIFDEIEEWLDAGRIRAVQAKSLADAGWSFFQAILKRTADNLRQARQASREDQDVTEACLSLQKLGMITDDPKMAIVWQAIRNAAGTNMPVIIHGETGTGKELVASAIHSLDCIQKKTKRQMVVWECTKGTQDLIESTLFGHKRGAFTGAVSDRVGLFESANGSTLFLDEIGEMSPDVQPKLLRAIQEQEVVKLGANVPVKVDVRIITATHRNLEEMVEQGTFRQDLYGRLNVLRIELPPLRERPRDIPLLTDYFLEKYNKEIGKNVSLTKELRRGIEEGPWPGNVRSLENFLKRIVANYDNSVSLKSLKTFFTDKELKDRLGAFISEPIQLAVPEDSLQLLAQLAIEVEYGPALTWRALGQDEKKDTENEQEVLKLLRRYVRQNCWKLLDALEDKLRHRESNDPRSIHFLLALLYLVLRPEHKADLNDFKQVLTISHWGYLKKIGDMLAESVGGAQLVFSGLVGKKKKNVFVLNNNLLSNQPSSDLDQFSQ